MKYLVDDNQLAITFRTVFEELISEQTRLSVAERVREICSDSSPKVLFSERNVDRTQESNRNRALTPNFREQIKFN